MLAAQRAIARHRGRIANTAGDSVLAEFPSAVNAVQCAFEAQQALRDATEGTADDKRVLFRIGIHVGDVMLRSGDPLGGGVNVAARLEALADAGGIVLSAAAHEHVKKILPLPAGRAAVLPVNQIHPTNVRPACPMQPTISWPMRAQPH